MLLKAITLLCLIVLIEARPSPPSSGKWGFENQNGGFIVSGRDNNQFSATANQKLLESNDGLSSVGVNAQYSRNDEVHGVGAGIGYKSPGGGLSANVNQYSGYGQDLGYNVGISANKNLLTSDDGRIKVDAVGSYNRHHGGPSGTGDPNFSGGVEMIYKW